MTAAKVESIVERAAKPAHVAAEPAQSILLSNLRIAPWNARKTFDPAKIEELANTIASQGLLIPLLVRPFKKKFYAKAGLGDVNQVWYLACRNVVGNENLVTTFNGKTAAENEAEAEKAAAEENGAGDFEIVAGHRRLRAVEKLNWKAVSCVVREMTDDEAMEIGLVDNVQREDVPALEEADAYAELKKRLGTPAAIAQRVGKEASYVARRLQLVSLEDFPRKALAERLITVDHALLLARLGADEQDVNLKWALCPSAGVKENVENTIATRIKDRDGKDRWSGPWEPESVASLKHHIEQHVGRKLSRAPWSLDDTTLVKDVPACSACPSNTKHNDTLFGDMNIAAATCEDGVCFLLKRTAFVQIKLSAATVKQEAGRGPAVRLSWKETTVKPRFSEAKAAVVPVDESGVNLVQVFKRGQWIEAKPKSCNFVRLGITVDWSDDANRGYMGSGEKLRKPGQELTVCIAPGCKAHKKEWEKPKSANTNAPYDAKAEEAKRENMRLAALAETKLRVRIAGEALAAVKALHLGMLRELLLYHLPNGRRYETLKAILPGVETILRAEKIDSAQFARAVALLTIEPHVNAWGHAPATDDRKEFIADMKRLGYDASKAWDKPTEPKPTKAAKPAKKSVLSAAAKKRIAEAQKKRWADMKKKAGRK